MYNVQFYIDEDNRYPENDHSYVETQKDHNQQIVDEVQAISKDWLYKMKHMITQLKINKAIDTSVLICDRCDYKNFRW